MVGFRPESKMSDDYGQLSRERKEIGEMSNEVEELVEIIA